ncbi:MAG: NfeD family protein [Rickettsiales bacterium]|nr:NfeD family protein [Rickettsiales bacterium]
MQYHDFLSNPIVLWALVATLLIFIEVFIVGIGIGFLFMGLGAYLTAVLLWMGILGLDNYVAQFSAFFFSSALFAAILWKPLKKLKDSAPESYNDMIGQYATVIEAPLIKGEKGRVKWSGSAMSARIDADSSHSEIAEGKEVVIKSVKGSTVFIDLE